MKNWLALLLFVLLSSQHAVAKAVSFPDMEQARLSLITCTPGPDLYSVFGHTAIRIEFVDNGVRRDWVYNYGTFEFSDDFYWKFTQGKLDYRLSKQDFGFFQEEYIYTGRGIWEQELLLTSEQKLKLFVLLEENYMPENRVYRYDFFYDNCATRVRDIINKSVGDSLVFSYVYPRTYTFREAIQNYLDYMPWSDFGIDLALGMPCDRTMESGQAMFLPDSLMKDFHFAYLEEGAIVSREQEILPKDFELGAVGIFTPMFVFGIFFILQMIIGLWWGKVTIVDRTLLFITGLVGLLVAFLWFFTDHQATKWNLNILWANPLALFFAFANLNKKWIQTFFTWFGAIQFLLILGWFFIPQRLHLATLPMVIGLLYISIRIARTNFIPKFGSQKKAMIKA